MKFGIQPKELKRALPLLKTVRLRKGAHRKPVLDTVHVSQDVTGDLQLEATDLETAIHVCIEPEMAESGEMCIPFDDLDRLSRAATGLLTFSTDSKPNRISVEINGGEAEIETEDAKDFPRLRHDTWKPLVSMPAPELLRGIQLTQFAVERVRRRYTTDTLCLKLRDGKVWLIATDQKRIAEYQLDAAVLDSSPDKSILIRLAAVGALAKALRKAETVQIASAEDGKLYTFLIDGNIRIVTTPVDGNYPPTDLILHDGDTSNPPSVLSLEVEGFTLALNAAIPFTGREDHGVYFAGTNAGITLRTWKEGKWNFSVPIEGAKLKGKPIDIGFNVVFLRDLVECARRLEEKAFVLRCKDAELPAFVTLGNGNWNYVIMPLRIPD